MLARLKRDETSEIRRSDGQTMFDRRCLLVTEMINSGKKQIINSGSSNDKLFRYEEEEEERIGLWLRILRTSEPRCES